MKQIKKIKGVNLGGWLVLEKWMDEMPFKNTYAEDETWLARELNQNELKKRLTKHRETFITEKDFKIISGKYGLNMVRIPVPYFIFGDRKPFIGCVEYLDKAFDWAKKYKLKIIIDLHTAPLGQNGYDNGGIMGVCKFHKNPKEVSFVISVLRRLAKRYGKRKALFGIEVLNEPIGQLAFATSPTKNRAKDKKEAYGSSGIPISFLKRFYINAYKAIREYMPVSKAVIFHDGFRLEAWRDFFVSNNMKNVYLDSHFYLSAMESFIPFHNKQFLSVINILNPFKCVNKYNKTKSNDDYMQSVSNIIPYKSMIYHKIYIAIEKLRIKLASIYTPLIIGEWCISVSYANDAIYFCRDKVNHILGTNYSEREFLIAYENNESVRRLVNKEKRKRYRQIYKLQTDAWNISAGNIYWNYKIANDNNHPANMHWKNAWDYRRCKKNGWI